MYLYLHQLQNNKLLHTSASMLISALIKGCVSPASETLLLQCQSLHAVGRGSYETHYTKACGLARKIYGVLVGENTNV